MAGFNEFVMYDSSDAPNILKFVRPNEFSSSSSAINLSLFPVLPGDPK